MSVHFPSQPGPPPQEEHVDRYELPNDSPFLRRLELAKSGKDLVTVAVDGAGTPTGVTAQ